MSEQQPTYAGGDEPATPRGFVRLTMDNGRRRVVHADVIVSVLSGTGDPNIQSVITLRDGQVFFARDPYDDVLVAMRKARGEVSDD